LFIYTRLLRTPRYMDINARGIMYIYMRPYGDMPNVLHAVY